MADEQRNELEKRLLEHSAYFSSLIDLIPVKYYLAVDEEEQENKFYKNRQRKPSKQSIKEASKKAKRARLDPSQHKTVHEIQKEAEENKFPSGSVEQNNDSEVAKPRFSVEKVQSGDLADLKSRLHSRIQDFQRKRKAVTRKTENRHPHQKKSKSDVKGKLLKQKLVGAPKKDKAFVKDDSLSSKKILNDSGDVVFSKFDFMEIKNEPRPGTKVKNYPKLLAKAEAHKKKLETLQSEDAEKAREFKEKHSWSHAIEKAEGVKQHDDPKLLKKAMKKREKEKIKSRKQWKERMDHQKKQADEKQKLRQKHIKERIEAKKGKKSSKGKKNNRPGF